MTYNIHITSLINLKIQYKFIESQQIGVHVISNYPRTLDDVASKVRNWILPKTRQILGILRRKSSNSFDVRAPGLKGCGTKMDVDHNLDHIDNRNRQTSIILSCFLNALLDVLAQTENIRQLQFVPYFSMEIHYPEIGSPDSRLVAQALPHASTSSQWQRKRSSQSHLNLLSLWFETVPQNTQFCNTVYSILHNIDTQSLFMSDMKSHHLWYCCELTGTTFFDFQQVNLSTSIEALHFLNLLKLRNNLGDYAFTDFKLGLPHPVKGIIVMILESHGPGEYTWVKISGWWCMGKDIGENHVQNK